MFLKNQKAKEYKSWTLRTSFVSHKQRGSHIGNKLKDNNICECKEATKKNMKKVFVHNGEGTRDGA